VISNAIVSSNAIDNAVHHAHPVPPDWARGHQAARVRPCELPIVALEIVR
jgi:hypothetical protein